MAMKNRVQFIKDRYAEGVTRKQHWLTMYQLVGEYVMTRKQNFLVSNLPGEFLTEQIFSSTAPNANRAMASSILGNLWPNGGRSFRLQRPRNIPDSAEVKQYYETISEVLADAMDAPEAGLSTALDEYMLDQGAFGISGIHTKSTGDFFTPLKFFAINIKNMVIEEDFEGTVVTVFLDYEYTVDQVVQEYGFDNVSKPTQDLHTNGKLGEKIRVLQLIEPRREGKFGFGNRSLPFSSIHIEFDNNKILRESGFKQHPIAIGRFTKALGEIYGRSPAMFAMPAILRLNMAWELVMRAGEKNINPPLYLLDNGALGNATVDTSPGGLSVFNTTSMGEKSPIGALFDVGDVSMMYQLIQQLTQDVTQAFFVDRLMDLNNETRMTLGEAQIRDRFRGEGLSGVFKRQETELFSRVIRSSFNITLDTGLLGVRRGSDKEAELIAAGIAPIYIPDPVLKAIDQGQKVYDIKYVSPANRILRIEELQGVTQLLDVAIGMAAGGMPDAVDVLDPDNIIRQVSELTGATHKTLRDTQSIKKLREIRAQQAQVNQQLAMAQVGADVAMKGAQAQSMKQGAISGRPRG